MADKIAYGLGDMANNCIWAVIVNFLILFYTDVMLVPAAAVGILMLVSRIWDAFNDPVIGFLSDNTETRIGKYKPWIIFGTVPLAILYVFTFWAHPQWSLNGRIVYMAVTYCILVFSYTVVNIPWGALNAVMTPDTDERASLSGVRLFFSFGTNAIVTVAVIPMVSFLGKGSEVNGWLYTTMILGALSIPLYLICGIKCKEVVKPPETQKKVKMKELIKAATKNPPLLIVLAGIVVTGFMMYGRAAVYAYYFRYYAGNDGLLGIYALLFTGITGISTLFVDKIQVKVGDKAKLYRIVLAIFATLLFITYFIPVTSYPVLFWVITAISGFVNGFVMVLTFSIIPDTAEYGEWKTGIRMDGFIYALASFAQKFGMAIGTAGVGLVLGAAGYTANVEQAENVLTAINFMMFILPAILCLLAAILFFFYKLDRKTFNKIVAEIEERNKSNNRNKLGGE
ncbi:hypothetical protein BJL90_00835 [Clostridium formicaceticum]|nr:hypothetical protein BJL90_00835 [Clostridium formicaceticum]